MRVAGLGVRLHLRDQSGAVRCVCPRPALGERGHHTAPLSGAKSRAQPRGPLASPGPFLRRLWNQLREEACNCVQLGPQGRAL